MHSNIIYATTNKEAAQKLTPGNLPLDPIDDAEYITGSSNADVNLAVDTDMHNPARAAAIKTLADSILSWDYTLADSDDTTLHYVLDPSKREAHLGYLAARLEAAAAYLRRQSENPDAEDYAGRAELNNVRDAFDPVLMTACVLFDEELCAPYGVLHETDMPLDAQEHDLWVSLQALGECNL